MQILNPPTVFMTCILLCSAVYKVFYHIFTSGFWPTYWKNTLSRDITQVSRSIETSYPAVNLTWCKRSKIGAETTTKEKSSGLLHRHLSLRVWLKHIVSRCNYSVTKCDYSLCFNPLLHCITFLGKLFWETLGDRFPQHKS